MSNSLLWKEFDVDISHCRMDDRTVRQSRVGHVLQTEIHTEDVSADQENEV